MEFVVKVRTSDITSGADLANSGASGDWCSYLERQGGGVGEHVGIVGGEPERRGDSNVYAVSASIEGSDGSSVVSGVNGGA